MNRDMRIMRANETLHIFRKQGFYYYNSKKIDVTYLHQKSVEGSFCIAPEQSEKIVEHKKELKPIHPKCNLELSDKTTLSTILNLTQNGIDKIGVLNFASAKNPGGGFLNGALAQEESLAIASDLYLTQLKNGIYYETNRNCRTMMYTDYMIYSPDVVFILDDDMNQLESPILASVLTAPAVNYGQVIQKGECQKQADMVMKNRMRKVLAVFAKAGNKTIILGAYGCGVFRNNPENVSRYWYELLFDENYKQYFENIIFAVYDNSKNRNVISSFENMIQVMNEKS